jgi:2,3-bisphosphoglycerate-independent phosphoglycerate mutase
MLMTVRPLVLIILDGFGFCDEQQFNAIAQAHTPHLDAYIQRYPHTLIAASGVEVGLPVGQFGNSEVGHLNIGAGRIIKQDITRIDDAIADGSFLLQPALLSAFATTSSGKIHIMGLLSDGGD